MMLRRWLHGRTRLERDPSARLACRTSVHSYQPRTIQGRTLLRLGIGAPRGAKEAWTPLPLRKFPTFRKAGAGGQVAIGSLYPTDSQPGSTDEYMKSYLKRTTVGWVAVVFGRARELAT
jgi:hypothetical protein